MFDKRCKSFKNSTEKPPFNYSQIIGMAMMDRGKMTLKEICNWIKDNFAYYKRFNKWNVSSSIIFIYHLLILFFANRTQLGTISPFQYISQRLHEERMKRVKVVTGN